MNKYINKYIKLIKKAKTTEELEIIINKIYNDL